MRKFRIKAREFKFFYTVIVHDNLKELRAQAIKHDQRVGLNMDHSGSYGVCHSYEKIKIFVNSGEEKVLNNVGVIRLAKTHLGSEVYTHELLHAALWIYKKDLGGRAGSKALFSIRQVTENEERLCHIYGRLYRDFLKKMYKYKLFT